MVLYIHAKMHITVIYVPINQDLVNVDEHSHLN